jgi:hypothetical protein
LYSGPKTSKGQYGTGFIITGCATQCMLGFEPINPYSANVENIVSS